MPAFASSWLRTSRISTLAGVLAASARNSATGISPGRGFGAYAIFVAGVPVATL